VLPDSGSATPLRASFAGHCRDHPPHALVVEAVSLLGRPTGTALDIGAGTLSSTRHLLSAGFAVDAVDPDPYTLVLAAELNHPRLDIRRADIQDIPIAEGRFDIIAATRVLHLIPRRDVDTLLPKLARALANGGILCATFLGVRDSWARTPWRATILQWDEVFKLTSELEVIRHEERDYDGHTAFGEYKHWHTLQCLLRKLPQDRRSASRAR
jgi:SAM-dependent methyltransferase